MLESAFLKREVLMKTKKIGQAVIGKLSHEGRGVSSIEGKVTFIENALPNEHVTFEYQKRKKSFDEGIATEISQPHPERTQPHCPHFDVCAGCSLQHMHPDLQIEFKHNAVTELFSQHQTTPENWLKPLRGPAWSYRTKARISVKYVHKKEKLLVGFREKNPRYVADIDQCPILDKTFGEKLPVISQCIESLSIKERVPQIEIACGDQEAALIIRHLEPLSADDQSRLKTLGKDHQWHIYCQPKGIDTIHLLFSPNDQEELHYSLPEHDISMSFLPQQFTQVNREINRAMLKQAMDLLELNSQDRVLDLFCGIGNFTLPIARQVAAVTGVEVDPSSIAQAKKNAQLNHIENTDFFISNLFEVNQGATFFSQSFNKILLDPPRAGAKEIVPLLSHWKPSHIVYVSCNPATLARDAEILKDNGFTLQTAGVMDMFPHTKHVEAMALFKR